MWDHILRYGVLLYFLATIAIVFLWRSYKVYRLTGRTPLVLQNTDDVYGYVGRMFKLVLVACVVVAVIEATSGGTALPGRIQLPGGSTTVAIGWALLLVALVWVAVAQAQMGRSWRIGIDAAKRTDLVQDGLFTVSRNPIFLGMRLQLLGLFLVLPSAVTLAILIAGEILMQAQVRLEEQHLSAMHGENFRTYRERVRRWL